MLVSLSVAYFFQGSSTRPKYDETTSFMDPTESRYVSAMAIPEEAAAASFINAATRIRTPRRDPRVHSAIEIPLMTIENQSFHV